MEILIAKELGFCFGVKRAVKTAQDAAKAASDAAKAASDASAAASSAPVYTLGPIVHNNTVVESLQDVGVWAKDAIDEIEADDDDVTVVIRAHGVPPEVLQAAEEKGLHVVNATCPLVIRVQQLSRTLNDDGYQVVIYGTPTHPEVIGIAGWAGEGAIVVQNLGDVAALPRCRKVGVVSQTTKVPANYQKIVGALMSKAQEVRAYNTICNATAHRQAAAVDVAQQVDVMVVIGGAHSSNTRRLAEVCAQVNPRTHRIATEGELDAAWFADATRVGISAGASTPSVTIDAVVVWLKAQG